MPPLRHADLAGKRIQDREVRRLTELSRWELTWTDGHGNETHKRGTLGFGLLGAGSEALLHLVPPLRVFGVRNADIRVRYKEVSNTRLRGQCLPVLLTARNVSAAPEWLVQQSTVKQD